MSVVDEPIKQFTIPSHGELEAAAKTMFNAINAAEKLRLELLHATGGVEMPLSEFAARPTVEDIGALYLFTRDLDLAAEALAETRESLAAMLLHVDAVRREWDDRA